MLKQLGSENDGAKRIIQKDLKIVIRRDALDNGKNGKYFKSSLSVKFKGQPLNNVNVQSTKTMDGGSNLIPGSYKGHMLNKSGSYENAIQIVGSDDQTLDITGDKSTSTHLIHPDRFTTERTDSSGGQGPWSRPLSEGCQIPDDSDTGSFNETISILNDLGLSGGDNDAAWSYGGSIDIEIIAPKQVTEVIPPSGQIM